MHMSKEETEALLKTGAIPQVGAVYACPPVMASGPNGEKIAVPQVAVAMVSDDTLAKIAAYTAKVTVELLFKELQERGIIGVQAQVDKPGEPNPEYAPQVETPKPEEKEDGQPQE